MTYVPSYVWPNPAFPFRVYLDHPKCRIFIIENVHHNFNWLRDWGSHFRETDYFFVLCGWYHSPAFAAEANTLFEFLGLNRRQFFFLFNCEQERHNLTSHGFSGEVVAQNAWLDEKLVMKPLPVEKRYRAIYVARRTAFKRHMLASKVSELALVAGINHGNAPAPLPDHVYLNDKQLTPEQVCEKINEAHCGLLLSEVEGACFASSEYLLCGIPVVSTPSLGGRDIWYDSYNSIVCDPNPDDIAAAVEEFVRTPRDPFRIRENHIKLAKDFRRKFVDLLANVLAQHGVHDIDAAQFFEENFIHKMRTSYKPDFSRIFRN